MILNVCGDITINNQNLPWVDEIRYLGIYILRSCKLKCSLDYAKRSFHRSLNSIFGKVGRIPSEDVYLESGLEEFRRKEYFRLDMAQRTHYYTAYL